METQTKLSSVIAPSFKEVHKDIKDGGHTHYWLAGGRGSAKSTFASAEIPLLLIKNPNMHAVILRKVGNTLKGSVYAQMEWAIDRLGLRSEFDFHKSPLEIERKSTHQKIKFLGVDDPMKIKSVKVPFGYTGIVFYEELDQFSGMEEIRSINQSLLRGGDRFVVLYCFNPPKSVNAWVNEEILIDDPDRMVHRSTYLDVPQEWLGEQFLLEAEKLKARNELLYRHEYLGVATGTGGAVFDNVEDMSMTDEQIDSFDRLYFGLDFGFAVDPLAFVSMYYDSKKEDLYIFDEVYRQKLTNSEAFDLIKPKAGRGRVIADSAEPKSIAEMKGYGLFIEGAKKSHDIRNYGYKWLQTRNHIYIDKRRCPNTYREFIAYEYERNRQGLFISSYPDGNDHGLDACRYGLSRAMGGGGMSINPKALI